MLVSLLADNDFNLLGDQFDGDGINFDFMPMDGAGDMEINLINQDSNALGNKFDTDWFLMGF